MDANETLASAGQDRRRALKWMVWAGTGMLWTVSGGIPRSALIGASAQAATGEGWSFAQISDSHIGFAKEPNMDTAGTLKAAVDLVGSTPRKPELLLHTGDVSQFSKP